MNTQRKQINTEYGKVMLTFNSQLPAFMVCGKHYFQTRGAFKAGANRLIFLVSLELMLKSQVMIQQLIV